MSVWWDGGISKPRWLFSPIVGAWLAASVPPILLVLVQVLDVSERDPGTVGRDAGDFGCCMDHSLSFMICLCNWRFQNMPRTIMPFPKVFLKDVGF